MHEHHVLMQDKNYQSSYKYRNIDNFYDTTEETPMRLRLKLFRTQFKELSSL